MRGLFLFNVYWITFQNENWPFYSLNEQQMEANANLINSRTLLDLNALEVQHLKFRFAIYALRINKKTLYAKYRRKYYSASNYKAY